jgi:phage terminase large subunit
MAESTIERAQQRLAEWRHDPVKMAWDEFEFTPDRWQVTGLRAFGDQAKPRSRISLQACVGPGKTAVEAISALNFMGCYAAPNRHPSALAISESGDNLRDNLWKEIAMWKSRSKYFDTAFELTTKRFFAKEHPKTWFISARSWSAKADVEKQGRTLSGLHSKFIAYFIDESGDIPPAVLRSAEQGLSNCEFGRIMQAGNPTSHDGMLYHASANEPHKWVIIVINGDPDDPERSPRIDIEWAREQIAQYGRDNAWVMATILGKFPSTAVNALLGPDDIDAAVKRHLRADEYQYVQKRIGIDIARFGDDSTAFAPRQGLAVRKIKTMRNQNSIEVTSSLLASKEKWGSELELIDDTGGHASGVIDQASLAGVTIYPVNFSGKADDPRFFNKRAEIAFRAAEAVKHGAAWPDDPQLRREALAQRFYYDHGKYRVIEKDQVKKKLNGHSPDRWDALCVTYAIVDMPAQDASEVVAAGGQNSRHKNDWDPNHDG